MTCFLAAMATAAIVPAVWQAHHATAAQVAPVPQDPPPKPILRCYDISDLLADVPNDPFESSIVPPNMLNSPRLKYPQPEAQQGGGNICWPAEKIRQPSNEECMEDMIRLLTDTVAPDSWKDNGGLLGSIRTWEHSLIVEQTPENQEGVKALLALVRKTRVTNEPITIDAYWICLAPRELPSLLAKRSKQDAPFYALSEEAISKIPLYAEAHLACMNGQTVHIASGRGRTVIVGADAIMGSAVSTCQPKVAQVLAGAVLQVKPTINGDAAVVDVRTALGEWKTPGEPIKLMHQGQATMSATQPSDPAVTGSCNSPTAIDRLNVLTQQMATTARIPLGKSCVIGGITLEPSSKTRDARQLYLVLRITAK